MEGDRGKKGGTGGKTCPGREIAGYSGRGEEPECGMEHFFLGFGENDQHNRKALYVGGLKYGQHQKPF